MHKCCPRTYRASVKLDRTNDIRSCSTPAHCFTSEAVKQTCIQCKTTYSAKSSRSQFRLLPQTFFCRRSLGVVKERGTQRAAAEVAEWVVERSKKRERERERDCRHRSIRWPGRSALYLNGSLYFIWGQSVAPARARAPARASSPRSIVRAGFIQSTTIRWKRRKRRSGKWRTQNWCAHVGIRCTVRYYICVVCSKADLEVSVIHRTMLETKKNIMTKKLRPSPVWGKLPIF